MDDILTGVDPNNNISVGTSELLKFSSALSNRDHFEYLLGTLQTLPSWTQFVESMSTLLGIKDELNLDWVNRLGGEIFIPVTGGGHASREVIAWMDELFTPKTTNYSSQPSQVKNSYGSSEFPGIALNGVINQQIELQLVPLAGYSEIYPAAVSSGKVRGEICVRHKDRSITVSYWKNVEATKAVVSSDGWYCTGDIGELDYDNVDESGNPTLAIIDRVSNSIELYVNGDSCWVDPSQLESIVSTKLSFIRNQMFILLGDRNQDSLVLVAVPTLEFVLGVFEQADAATKQLVTDSLTAVVSTEASEQVDQQQVLYEYLCDQQFVQRRAHKALLSALNQAGVELPKHEIPCGVILTSEAWTIENKLLTTTGKPRRSEIRLRFQKKVEETYARVLATASDIDIHGPPAAAPDDTGFDRSLLTQQESLSITFPSVCEIKCDRPIPQIFAMLLKVVFYKLVGPEAVKTKLTLRDPSRAVSIPIKLGWGGYIQQDEAHLPILADSNKKNYQHFLFATGSDKNDTQLNSLLSIMKQCVQERSQRNDDFVASRQLQISSTEKELEATEAEFGPAIRDSLAELQTNTDVFLREGSTGYHPMKLFSKLLRLLTMRQLRLRQLYAQLDAAVASIHPDEKQIMDRYNYASAKLRIVAPRLGVRIPYFIDLGGWFTWIKLPDDVDLSTSELPTFLSQSLGEAKVVCVVSGTVLEESLRTSGRERFHCLSGNRIDRSIDSQLLVDIVFSCVHRLLHQRVNGADEVANHMVKVFAFNPTKLKTAEELLDPNQRNMWVIEKSHFWHLREGCDRPLVRYVNPVDNEISHDVFVSNDSPAGFISRAFAQYANRLALGIPDEPAFDSLSIRGVVKEIGHTFCAPMADAAKITLLPLDHCRWITYRDLGYLAELMARAIRSKVPRGSFVGISGGHSIEWAVCDFACALAGVCSVGIHLTYDAESAYHVLATTGVSLLCCQESILSILNSDDNDIDAETAGFERWSLESVISVHKEKGHTLFQLRHVLLFDRSMNDLTKASEDVIANSPISIASAIDLLTLEKEGRDSGTSQIELESPDDQPAGGLNGLSTILFTSGSTGTPKGVMVTAKAFYHDIKTRNYVEPLITVSYIPLSHSSDRMKMWEFLGNGGRIGLAFFGHGHWLEHERAAKKDGVLSTIAKQVAIRDDADITKPPTLQRGPSLSLEHLEKHRDILSLFLQIRSIAPSAMACPPNIWNDLYHLYQINALTNEEIASLFGPRISFIITGGAPTSNEVIQWIKSKLLPNCNFANSYGATEVGAITSNG